MSADSVDYVVLTRIDLDHDRGAEETIGVFNNARLMVHPRGVRHMVYPGKVVAGVTAACGEAEVRRLHGDIVPIEEHQIIPAMHGLRVDLAGREHQGMHGTIRALWIAGVARSLQATSSGCLTANSIPTGGSSFSRRQLECSSIRERCSPR